MRITRIEMKAEMPARKRVAAYARVSADEADNIDSLSAQISRYSTLIQSNPAWDYAGVFSDEGITGTKMDRPGFLSLMEEADKGNIDIILTKSISRFSRNTVDLLTAVRHPRDIGVSVRFERENIDTLSESGELMLTLLASFAEEESHSISENVRWAIRKRFEKGIGNSFVLYGYRWDGTEFHIIEDEAEVVRRIFSEYLSGKSPQMIAKELTAEGIRPRRNAKEFGYSAVFTILRQEKYTGDSILQKTFTTDFLKHTFKKNDGELPRYLAEGTHPAIISHEAFRRTQNEIERRRCLGFMANQRQRFSVFTRKVFCSSCGHTYRKKICTRSNTIPYVTWVCGTKFSHGASVCSSRNVPNRVLWELTADVLGADTVDDALFNEMIERILVSEYTLTYQMKDGTEEIRHWEPLVDNPIYRRNA